MLKSYPPPNKFNPILVQVLHHIAAVAVVKKSRQKQRTTDMILFVYLLLPVPSY